MQNIVNLNKLSCTGTLRQVLICLRPPPFLGFCLGCTYVQLLFIQGRWGGGGVVVVNQSINSVY
jgi:hypothetical protein